MNFRRLIICNFKGNFRTYAAHFISSTFAVWIFYIFGLLLFHPQLGKDREICSSVTLRELARISLVVSLLVIGLLSLLFLWYSFSIFLKRRKRDLSIYLLLGIEHNDLRNIVFFENMLLGFFATVSGLFLGIVSSKLMLLFSQNLLHLQNGLTFCVPFNALALAFGVYLLLFFLISFVSIRMLQSEKVSALMKEEKPRSEPKAHWLLAGLGMLLVFLGYGSVIYFAFNTQNIHFFLLILGVLSTVVGTIVSFQQGSVFILTTLKKQPALSKGTRLLTISEWVYRMRDNANMYSLLAISTSVAFVGIALMFAIGDQSFSSVQGISVAYIFTQASSHYSVERKANEVKQKLEAEGYQPVQKKVEVVDVYVPLDEVDSTEKFGKIWFNSFSVIRESDYQALMKQLDEPADSVKEDQLLVLSSSYTERKERLAVNDSDRQKKLPVVIGEKVGVSKKITVIYSPNLLSLDYIGLSVVTDKTFEKWKKEQVTDNGSGFMLNEYFIWLDYSEWAENLELTKKINQQLDSELTEIQEKINERFQQLDEKVETMSLEELNRANPYMERSFFYSSKMQLFQETRERNGLILMLTVLIGSVFFIFSASIIYFRLFADLEKDRMYHRMLHLLGVTPAERHRVNTRQLQVMYFLPAMVAMVHFAVAMCALYLLVALPVWFFYLKVVGSYLVFQIIFYWLCRYRYQQALDSFVESIES